MAHQAVSFCSPGTSYPTDNPILGEHAGRNISASIPDTIEVQGTFITVCSSETTGSGAFVKRKWKILLIVLGVLAVAGGVYASIKMKDRGLVTVQTAKTLRQDLASVVTASGEIKPRTYVNI